MGDPGLSDPGLSYRINVALSAEQRYPAKTIHSHEGSKWLEYPTPTNTFT